jgi:hypothetical protein
LPIKRLLFSFLVILRIHYIKYNNNNLITYCDQSVININGITLKQYALKPLAYLSLLQKKRVPISDYSLEENSIEISNTSFTPRDFLNNIDFIEFI